jgi:hypothetical protein
MVRFRAAKVGVKTITPHGALKISGYNNTYKIKFGTTLSTGMPLGANQIYCNGLFRFLTANALTDKIATFHKIDNYDDSISTPEKNSIKTIGVNITGNLNISRNTKLNNVTTCISSLNVSGKTTLNNFTTINSSLNVVGDINTSGLSVLGINTTLSTKQNNLTCSNPFLNTLNTISLKYDNTNLTVDASGNLTVNGDTSHQV